jgi:RHS repeat-associated protein
MDGSFTAIAGSAIDSEILFTGQRFDAPMGLHQFRMRLVDSRTGRFICRDPLGYPSGPNAYAQWFVPSASDPLGLDDQVLPAGFQFDDTALALQYWKYFSGKHKSVYIDLLSSLYGLCNLCTCSPDCDIQSCRSDAQRIAASIYMTLEYNWTWLWLANITSKHAYQGYLCWEWAWAFYDAFKKAAGTSKCFDATLGKAYDNTPDGGKDFTDVHYWLRIDSKCDQGKYVYVDDSYSNSTGDFVYDVPPFSSNPSWSPVYLEYDPYGSTNVQKRSKCVIPKAY